MRVTLYSKPGCLLCDELKADLVEYQQELGFALEERNIELDPADLEKYRYLIPVLDIENGPLLYPPHHWDVTGAALRAAAGASAKRN